MPVPSADVDADPGGWASTRLGNTATAVVDELPELPAATAFASGQGSDAAQITKMLPGYLPWLDVLRFMACFLVILLHTGKGGVGLGHAGVALFFSISGFLIGRVLLENPGLSQFYARRFLRIYPAYAVTIALLAFSTLTPLMHQPGGRELFWHNCGYYLTFTFQLSPDAARLPLLIVWSLCVEELFYLLLPLVFLLKTRLRVAVALAGILALLLVPRFSLLPNGTGTWYLFPLNLFAGVLLALAKPRLRSTGPWLALAAIVLLIVNAWTNWFHIFGPVSAIVCTAAVWSLAVYEGSLPRLLQPFRWMGRLSYGMYLLHLFCLPLAIRLLLHAPLPAASRWPTVLVLTLALTVVAAWLLQRTVEDPALGQRHHLGRHPALRYALATAQVSLIPLGVLLAVLR